MQNLIKLMAVFFVSVSISANAVLPEIPEGHKHLVRIQAPIGLLNLYDFSKGQYRLYSAKETVKTPYGSQPVYYYVLADNLSVFKTGDYVAVESLANKAVEIVTTTDFKQGIIARTLNVVEEVDESQGIYAYLEAFLAMIHGDEQNPVIKVKLIVGQHQLVANDENGL